MEMGGPSEGGLSWGRCGVGQENLELGSSLSMRIIERVFQGLWLPLC